MVAWIESHQSLRDHPKLYELCEAMNWSDVDLALGKLHRFWYWCVDHAEDGDLSKYSDAQIGRAVGLNGADCKRFVEAMVKSRWIDRDPYFRVHDWLDTFGSFLRSRYKREPEKYEKIKKMYLYRDSTGTVPVQSRSTNLTLPNLTKPDLSGFSRMETSRKETLGQVPAKTNGRCQWDDRGLRCSFSVEPKALFCRAHIDKARELRADRSKPRGPGW